jgi:hypothetical protein
MAHRLSCCACLCKSVVPNCICSKTLYAAWVCMYISVSPHNCLGVGAAGRGTRCQRAAAVCRPCPSPSFYCVCLLFLGVGAAGRGTRCQRAAAVCRACPSPFFIVCASCSLVLGLRAVAPADCGPLPCAGHAPHLFLCVHAPWGASCSEQSLCWPTQHLTISICARVETRQCTKQTREGANSKTRTDGRLVTERHEY